MKVVFNFVMVLLVIPVFLHVRKNDQYTLGENYKEIIKYVLSSCDKSML